MAEPAVAACPPSKVNILQLLYSHLSGPEDPPADRAADPQMRTVVENAILRQLEHMLTIVHHRHVNHQQAMIDADTYGCACDSHNTQTTSSPCPPPLPFSIAARQSSIVGSGVGVFATGPIRTGTLVSLYPGVIYAREDIPVASQLVWPGNDYLISRTDGTILDGRPIVASLSAPAPTGVSPSEWAGATASERMFRSCLLRDKAQRCGPKDPLLDPRRECPFVVGNLLNHPNPPNHPNCVSFTLDIPATFPRELWKYIPNVPFRPREPADARLVAGLALVAAKDIAPGEELFLDYRYDHINKKTPAWFVPTCLTE
ncbi:hypothetical protein PAPYR_2918 [Paratrimastix pyriformis]|uniref:SET domain-containing protein n=1 Tax=Paratrimastix pyriformis TaxID=342808 RepID=A0ABQ8UND3_9EUKA|nr:hypothetical protein PAPYR_2918 [Paratrimastix pyriformis]